MEDKILLRDEIVNDALSWFGDLDPLASEVLGDCKFAISHLFSIVLELNYDYT